MLQEFIVANREKIIARARIRMRERTAARTTEKLEHGVPLFLTQLAVALRPTSPAPLRHLVDALSTNTTISESAALHGHELLKNGFTVGQVVYGYGDVCQIVTELASETKAAISTDEFNIFNRCIDDAIAGAVTAYGHQRERDLAYDGSERMSALAHELRNLLSTAMFSFGVLKKGIVGLAGITGALHSRSLSDLCTLVERSLAQVRLEAGVTRLQRLSVADFIEEVGARAMLHAEGHDVHFTVTPVEAGVAVDVDHQLLSSALSNLLQNAFKFTRPHGHVTLTTRITEHRVLIDVFDECGGLPPGNARELFEPFTQKGSDHSGLGLSIALSVAKANLGDLYVENLPGKGCVFTLDLPRQQRPPAPILDALPEREQDSSGSNNEF